MSKRSKLAEATAAAAAFIDTTNAEYERVHRAFEDQFWGTKMFAPASEVESSRGGAAVGCVARGLVPLRSRRGAAAVPLRINRRRRHHTIDAAAATSPPAAASPRPDHRARAQRHPHTVCDAGTSPAASTR